MLDAFAAYTNGTVWPYCRTRYLGACDSDNASVAIEDDMEP
jgi:hypothetical protein